MLSDTHVASARGGSIRAGKEVGGGGGQLKNDNAVEMYDGRKERTTHTSMKQLQTRTKGSLLLMPTVGGILDEAEVIPVVGGLRHRYAKETS